MTDRKKIRMTRTGEKRIMNCGMEAVIIAYRNANDLDVRFADGTIVEHKIYNSFKKGSIVNPQIYKMKRIGENRMMNCGMEAEIIAYRRYNDMDVRFADGTVVEHITYSNFHKRMIANPNYTFADQKIGKKRMMNCGMEAEIVTYRKNNDIDVRFADGTFVEHKRYDYFKKGKIPNPNINVNASKRIGKKHIMNCGMEAKIIAYRGNHDIDVQFTDGTITKHKSYRNFKEGKIANINMNVSSKRTREDSLKRTGEKQIMNCGMEAEIISYRSSTDIDVRFADQTIIKNKSYGSFVRGCISNPNLKKCKSV